MYKKVWAGSGMGVESCIEEVEWASMLSAWKAVAP